MIKVLVKQNNNQIVNLSITGHADSGEYGKDLVCAGVSTVGIGEMNMLSLIHIFYQFVFVESI